MKYKISKEDLLLASKNNIISEKQVDKLWNYFSSETYSKASFTGLNVTYYFGGLIIISAMTWFATEAFATYNSFGLIIISSLYFLVFLFVGKNLSRNKTTYIPGGLILTVSVFMIPLLIFSVQNYFKIWVFESPGHYQDYYVWIKSGWFFMEIGTIATAIIFIFLFRFPFLTFPLAFTLWFLSMDLTPIIFDISNFSWDQRKTVSLFFGLFILVATYFIDRKTKRDYAFWLYLFGLLSFWIGLSLLESNSEFNKFIYFCINIFLIIISVLFHRKSFIVFGSLGVYGYLYHLSDIVFKDSLSFPVVLSIIGMSIIFIGLKYNKNKNIIEEYINSILPEGVLKLLPPNRE